MDDRKPSDLVDRIVVRTPDGMRDRLNEVARANGRSANAEAVKALDAWLTQDTQVERVFVRLPERVRERVDAAARLNGRSALDEIVARVADSFSPIASHHGESAQLHLRAEIRDAMHEVIEGLIGDPQKLKLLGYTPPKRDSDEPVSD
ncbi:MAG: Arc family DNA-binding protein [Janthinobacterium lividum]